MPRPGAHTEPHGSPPVATRVWRWSVSIAWRARRTAHGLIKPGGRVPLDRHADKEPRYRQRHSGAASKGRRPAARSPLAGYTRLRKSLLKEIERSVGQYRSVPAAFDREYQRVQTELRSSTEKLAGIRHRMEALSRSSDEVRQQREVANNSARFLGQLEQALRQYDQVQVGDLAGEVASLRERIRALEGEVREDEVEKRTANALRRIGAFAQRLMPRLDAERPDDPLSFSVSDLTVKVTGKGSREDYLWEIGSASNWLSYHIAIVLAFQEYFLSQAHSPAPSFLVFDQPSQAYFPQLLLARAQEDEAAGREVAWKDEDVEAVRKVFQVFADAVKSAAGRLQVIVLDHATDTVWGNVKPLNLAANWRGGEKLVPPSWLS